MALILCSMSAAVVPTGASSFTGSVSNAGASFSSGTLQLEGTTPTSVNCFSTGAGTGGTVTSSNANQCAGDPFQTGILSTSATSVTSTLTSVGTASATGGTVALSSCGVEQVADPAGADTGLVYGGVTYGSAFTSASQSTFNDTGVTLDGVTTSTYVGTIASRTAPATFTLTAWVKSSTSTGGVIMGMSNNQTNLATASSADRMLFVNSTGHVVFNMYGATTATKVQATSTAVVTNGAWHFVVATYSTSGGLNLYVDSATAVHTADASDDPYTGAYWHLGWNPTSGWTGAPSSNAWTGSLYGLSVIPSALTAANVTTLYNETSAANYATAIASTYAATDFWRLDDSGTVPYTGNVPALGAPGCSAVQVFLQDARAASTTCAYPSGAGVCATYGTLSALSLLGAQPLALAPTSANAATIVISTKVSSTVAGVVDLHVIPTLVFATSLSPWTASLSYAGASLEL